MFLPSEKNLTFWFIYIYSFEISFLKIATRLSANEFSQLLKNKIDSEARITTHRCSQFLTLNMEFV